MALTLVRGYFGDQNIQKKNVQARTRVIRICVARNHVTSNLRHSNTYDSNLRLAWAQVTLKLWKRFTHNTSVNFLRDKIMHLNPSLFYATK
ncbi:hypothetical protein PoB_005893300 [Plakobranchus ocellatus]|uniref:Uncharacterized protein n=1 Tax=Plakobranchus ocellatus TaxID=259542 RepID=A0AAV4CMD4_9GAST|nr:hypothetical protein PoB_005893300 [Plakobranchus ocellatus]